MRQDLLFTIRSGKLDLFFYIKHGFNNISNKKAFALFNLYRQQKSASSGVSMDGIVPNHITDSCELFHLRFWEKLLPTANL